MSEDKKITGADQPESDSAEEQFLFFTIADIPLAVPFIDVLEVINLSQSILTVPNVDPHVSGIINFRGSVLAIINLVMFLSDGIPNRSSFRHILVIQKNSISAGLLIDDVPKVAFVLEENIQPVIRFKRGGFERFVLKETEFNSLNYGILDVKTLLIKRGENEAKA